MTHFAPIDDFQGNSYSVICPITQFPKQGDELGKQPHEVDSFIFRGPEIMFHDGRGDVSLGFFDVRPDAIRQAAVQYLDMSDAEDMRQAAVELQVQKNLAKNSDDRANMLNEMVTQLSLQNAELITQRDALLKELGTCQDELPFEFDETVE